MARRYFSSSAAATTLSAGITAGNTAITVGSITGFPVTYPYTLILDPDTASEEVVDVTAGGGLTLTVARGVDGTTAVSHSLGSAVQHGVSARDFNEANDHVNKSADVHGIGPGSAVVGTNLIATLTNKTIEPASNNIPWIPRGKIGYAQAVANQAGITAQVDMTNLSIFVTAEASRRIRITGRIYPQSTVANDVVLLTIHEGATQLQQNTLVLDTANQSQGMTAEVVITPSSGSHTYKLTIMRLVGTGSVTNAAAATFPSFVLVEDIGAA